METTTPPVETQATVSAPTPQAVTPHKGVNKKLVIIIVIIGLLALAGIGLAAVWFLSQFGNNDLTPNNGNGSSSANSITIGENGTDLTEAQQVTLFQNLARNFEDKQKKMKVTMTSSNGDVFTYVTDPAKGIIGYYGTSDGAESSVYITADGEYFLMEGAWYFMQSAQSTSDLSTTEVPDYSKSDFAISDEQEIESRTTYDGITACPGTYQGTCYKFTIGDTSGSSTAYINANGDLVYSTSTDSTGTSTNDFVYDNINVSLPAAALSATNYSDYIQNLMGSH